MFKSAVLLLILTLLVSITAPFLSVKANPYRFPAPHVDPPEKVHLIITIVSPTQNTVYDNGTINVCFNANVEAPSSINKPNLGLTTYQGDWMQKIEFAPWPKVTHTSYFHPFNFSITGIPFGEHSINFTSTAQGITVLENMSGRVYILEKTRTVKFSMRANPIITFASHQNATVETSASPLNFTVDHPVTEMAYCLDGQESIPISGNTTLTGLSNGQHNVTVYATDEYDYTGVSDILFFNVNASEFPTTLVVASISIVAVIASVILFYLKKGRK